MSRLNRFGLGALGGVLLAAGGGVAGDLTPPGPPGSTMKTLQDIYDKIDEFSGYMGGGDALASEILAGRKAWVGGTEVTGTMPNVGQQNVTPGTAAQAIPQGHHDGTGSVAGDADLVAGNVKKDVTIFGVTGTHAAEVVYTNSTAAVPNTGQAWSYAVGDDGDMKRGVAWPDPRFTDNGDGTVTDNLTGLLWLKNANAFGTRTWETALTDCRTLNSGEKGLSDGSVEGDWRLPNVRELASLIDYGTYSPALPWGHPFTAVEWGYYWSSSTMAGMDAPLGALAVTFGHGLVGYLNKTGMFNLWPVRAGQ